MEFFRVSCLLLWIILSYSTAEERILKGEISEPPTEPLKLQQSQPYVKEQPGIFSRLTNWIFPKNDLETSPALRAAPQYLPPPQQYLPPRENCNPCNKEPWIPIPGKSAKAAAGFDHPQVGGHMEGLNPPPAYGPPPAQYGPPKSLQSNYGPPKTIQSNYGPPKTLQSNYGPPPKPPTEYGPPPLPNYGPPPPFRQSTKLHPTHQFASSNKFEIKDYMVPPAVLPVPAFKLKDVQIIGMVAPPPPKRVPILKEFANPPLTNTHDTWKENFPPYQPLQPGNTGTSSIKIPAISRHPLVPIYNAGNFKETVHSIQILPSINVAQFISTIEHPASVVQSPLLDLSVKDQYLDNHISSTINYGKLSENPIIVDDSQVAASDISQNITRDYKKGRGTTLNSLSTDLKIDEDLLGIINTIAASTPQPTWRTPTYEPKTKHVQIIVPYFNFNQSQEKYSTLVPVYKPPPISQYSVWHKYVDQLEFTPPHHKASSFKTTTQVYNIQDLLKDQQVAPSQNLNFDIISLQKTIDDWTQQSYGDRKTKSTKLYKVQNQNELESSGSSKQEVLYDVDNSIDEQSTMETTTMVETTPKPKYAKTKIFPVPKEKVYIVTPAPLSSSTSEVVGWSAPPKVEMKKNDSSLLYEHPKYTIRIEGHNNTMKENGTSMKIIFSEWPHKINNLQTTTSRPTSKHPLFGLMDMTIYTPPADSTVSTITGHSKVTSSVTQTSVAKKLPGRK